MHGQGRLELGLASRVMLAEYDRLKQEQLARIGVRDNLIYAVLLASAAVVPTTVSQGSAFLLLLPPVAVLIGWTYLVNDWFVSSLGRYLREELGPRLGGLAGESLLGWEYQGRDPDRPRRKRFQLAADLLAFCGLPLGALTAFWLRASLSPLLVVLSAVEALVVLVLAAEIVRYAELTTN